MACAFSLSFPAFVAPFPLVATSGSCFVFFCFLPPFSPSPYIIHQDGALDGGNFSKKDRTYLIKVSVDRVVITDNLVLA